MSMSEKENYPVIPPVEEPQRPFWSVMIPTMERPRYLELALKSVLAQNIPAEHMQIEVIGDEITSEATRRMVEAAGGSRVLFHRQEGRKSQSEQWTACIRRARGRWVHVFHDDDVLFPGFYKACENFIQQHQESVLVFCRAQAMDEQGNTSRLLQTPPENQSSGIVQNAMENLLLGDYIVAPSAVVKREVYERIGGPDLSLHYALDWELFMRVTAAGPIGYIHEPLVGYRTHQETVSENFIRSGFNADESYKVVKRHLSALSPDIRESVWRKFREKAAKRSLRHGRDLLREGFYRGACRHAWWTMKLGPSRDALVLWAKIPLAFLKIRKP